MKSAAVCLVAVAAILAGAVRGRDQPSMSARELHDRAVVIDTHDDTTQRLIFDEGFDIGRRNDTGSVDIPRMREGGLDALFLSIWMPGDITGARAVQRALQQIDAVREAVRRHPDDLVLATSVAEIRKASLERKIAVLMGVEGGHMINDDLGQLRQYVRRGVRYLTLTHSRNTTWADSSGDKPAHNGLTAFGNEVVRELNRLGVMVDVSHVSDKTFRDVIDTSRAPVIASHSSCRALCDSPRNMTDDMLRALAKDGGVVMINYNAGFLSEPFRVAAQRADIRARVDAARTKRARPAQPSAFITMPCGRERNQPFSGPPSWNTSIMPSELRASTMSDSARTSTARPCRLAWKTYRSCRTLRKRFSAGAIRSRTSSRFSGGIFCA
jgi:membrane dipeptidase